MLADRLFITAMTIFYGWCVGHFMGQLILLELERAFAQLQQVVGFY